MRNVDILYFIEHVARELDIACAIKHLAHVKHGLHVEIASLVFDLDSTLQDYRSRAMVVPYCYSQNDFGVRDMLRVKPRVPIFNLAFEHLCTKASVQYEQPKGEIPRKQIFHLAGGDYYAGLLQSIGVPQEHLQLVGSPTCQLYREPYRSYFEIDRTVLAEQHGLDPQKRWIFFPENFSFAFVNEKALEHYINAGFQREELDTIRDYTYQTWQEIATWCAQAAKIDDVELIIRPRPATSSAAFAEKLRETIGELPEKNFHIVKAGSIREWIFASQVIISNYSTSLMEAAVTEKPVYLLLPDPLPDCMTCSWLETAPQVTTEKEFIEMMTNVHPSSESKPLTDWIFQHELAWGDSIDNIVEVLANRLADPQSLPIARIERSWAATNYDFKQLLRRAKTKLRASVGIVKNRTSSSHESDNFSQLDVQQRTERWAKILTPSGAANTATARKAA